MPLLNPGIISQGVKSLAYALAMSGERSQAKRILDELIKISAVEHVSPYYAAAVHAALGDTDQVFEWLDTACRQRDMWMGFLKVDPIWDGVRSDPRFAAMLRCVGLEA